MSPQSELVGVCVCVSVCVYTSVQNSRNVEVKVWVCQVTFQ